VKIRGFRIELGEVEGALSRHPQVRECAAVVREDAPNERRLVAYFVAADGADVSGGGLRAFLKESLPDQMIPSAFVRLDALPLSPNGKVNRRALPAPDLTGRDQEGGYVAPQGVTEETIAGIWQRVLGVERVGAEDNFFALGGHSLLATQIISRVADACGVRLPLRSIFETPTVAGLAAAAAELQAPADDAELAAMLAELEGLSDEEAMELLAADGA
jgi:acyl carrier protein